jgi:dTDP-4-dehydrorhamnose 3,5-epimerase
LPLAGLKLIERRRLGDERGFLSRLFCSDELALAGWQKPIAQINHTYTSQRGTIRGLHYQTSANAEMKLVSCIRGEVWDIVVDLRSNSSTFMHWHSEILSEENEHALLIPEGFAHGFQSLSDEVELIYLHTEAYSPKTEAALHFNDPILGIQWPLSVSEISERDQSHALLTSRFNGV